MAGTLVGFGHSHSHGVAVPGRGGAEPRRHSAGGLQRQPGVLLPLGLVLVLIPGELSLVCLRCLSWFPMSDWLIVISGGAGLSLLSVVSIWKCTAAPSHHAFPKKCNFLLLL